jgi:hypothetical protein
MPDKTLEELTAELDALQAENRELRYHLQKENTVNIVNVRWFDGYLETFEATEVRFGNAYLWMRLSNGQNRHIPLGQVRWFSLSIESHAKGGDST